MRERDSKSLTQNMVANPRCTFSGCEKPEHGTKFFLIEEGKMTGDKDWSSIAGSVLCKACYQQFMRSGKLERTRNKPLARSARRCAYADCDRPEHGELPTPPSPLAPWHSHAQSPSCTRAHAPTFAPLTPRHCPTAGNCFYQIELGKTAGGQDWTPLAGSVLCKACYEQYKTRGTLERQGRPSSTPVPGVNGNKPLPPPKQSVLVQVRDPFGGPPRHLVHSHHYHHHLSSSSSAAAAAAKCTRED